MSRPFTDPRWLGALVDEALASHDPAAARGRLPPEVAPPGRPVDLAAAARILVARSLRTRRPPDEPVPAMVVFRENIRDHLCLLLDLRLLGPASEPSGAARVRAELAAFLAAATGEVELAMLAGGPASSAQLRAAERALTAAAARLRERFWPPGDPVWGLPLSSGSVAVIRRHLARIAGGYLRTGGLDPAALMRHAQYAARELVLLSEALAGLLASAAPPERKARWVRGRQMARLGLRGATLREARRGVAAPRAPQELAAVAPAPVRGFLFEQILLAQLRTRLPSEAPARFAEAFASNAGLDPQAVVAAQLEAAVQSGDPQAWFDGSGGREAALDWHALADDWGAAADTMVDRVSSTITANLSALATEIRETGELGALLGKAAGGQRLTPEEKRKVRAQLVDLAKAVPALALFAAPGGTILLPLLAKILPFNLLPGAWDKDRLGARQTPPPGAPTAPGAPAATPEPQQLAAPGDAAEPATADPPREPRNPAA